MLLALNACFEEPFPYPDTGELQFSTDTLTFDTVFTAVGSATRSFKVINASDQRIRIDRITLAGGSNSNFRLNVDGLPLQTSLTGIEIPAQDSIYVFAEVTVDPNNDQTPFIIYDEVQFSLNGQEQRVTLEAWGQNAIYVGSKGGLAALNCTTNPNPRWTADLPYVIYGILFVDCELTLDPGTRVYIHGGLVDADSFYYNDGILFMLENGSLRINGTPDNPVIIQGDRLEAGFSEQPGQWAGIRFGAGSRNNSLNHAIIKNAIVGVRVDSTAELEMRNTTIHNTQSSNVLGYHAGKIWAENCLFFSSNAGNNVQLEYGGQYDFRHCTLATLAEAQGISHSAPVLRMGNFICTSDALGCPDYAVNTLDAQFRNCIIYGSRRTEIALSERDPGTGQFNYTLDHCLIKVDSTEEDNAPIFANCTNCLANQDPLFVSVTQLDYQLDTLSPADGAGTPLLSRFTSQRIALDLLERPRSSTAPDLGCYEYTQ